MKFIISELEKANSDVLEHHGILGQKWGRKQGPPYPLDAGDHSPREKAEGYKKSIGGGRNEELYDRKDKKSKVETKSKKEKYSKEEVNEYREKLIKKYEKSDPEAVKLIKTLDEDTLRADMQHRENVKKALIIGAAAVGIGVAAYTIYSRKSIHDFQIAKDALIKGNLDDADRLIKKGLSIDTVNKIITLDAKHQTINDGEIFKIIKNGVLNDMDLNIKNARVKRMDFRPDFDISKVKDPLFAVLSDKDASAYKQGYITGKIKNRSGSGSNKEVFQLILDATEELKIPSREKAKSIYKQLMDLDPSFDDDLRDASLRMAKKNNPLAFMGVTKWSDSDWDWLKNHHPEFDPKVKGPDYLPNAMMGANGLAREKMSKAFKDAGYNTIIDIHDVMDKVSDLPIIALDPSIFKVSGKKKFKVYDLYS